MEGISSHGLLSVSNQVLASNDFDALKISIASPEKIRSWSYGEVKKSETVNYRTSKTEQDGLFCQKIFGPVKDYECACGKYKRIKYKGMVCERCGVEVTSSSVRRERMGHIELATPVSHIWFLSKVSAILDIMPKNLEKVLYFDSYIVVDGKMTALEDRQILSETDYQKYKTEFGEDAFDAEMGAGAIRKLLEKFDLEKEKEKIKKELDSTKSDMKKNKMLKRLYIIDAFIKSNSRPEWMILTVLPVIPPDLRPLVQLDGGNFASADLNELYRRVINRNNRLKKLMELSAPEIIIRNEQRMLQEAVDSLLDNTKSINPVKSNSKRVLKSLSDTLKGKQGRFRQNLLGKRVDYSGRSVIVVGPHLKLNQCGIPKKMALELFRPFIYSKLEARGLSNGVKHSKRLVDEEREEVWDILDEIIKEHPVLLNRAPTLHRLGVQAFEPVLVEGKAIQLHPLTCKAFNADFDGDQMAVHIPLSIESQTEAKTLMMSTNNILNPRDGKPIITPSQDMIWGLYYITSVNNDKDWNKPDIAISSKAELEHALFSKRITLHDPIILKYSYVDSKGETHYNKVITTAGREKIYDILPDKVKEKYGFSLVNKVIDKKAIEKIINLVFEETDNVETAKFCDSIMQIGFKNSTFSGLSIGKDDMIVPDAKQSIINDSNKEVEKVEGQYQEGLITSGERYNKIIDIWNKASNSVKDAVITELGKDLNPLRINSFYAMAKSGARGNNTSLQQICGMRGLLAKATGEIIETPILSNFKEGLSILEYFISTYTGRKSTVDTALKTANAGYLTRRLVDVSQDCFVVKEDCGTEEGLTMEAKIVNGEVKVSLKDKIIGRTSLHNIRDNNGDIIVKAGELITEQIAEQIEKAGIKKVAIRSVLTCKCKDGVCAKCYGRDMTTKRVVSVGEAVGIIAAQAIGETGTQLTMNTRHLGAAMVGGNESNIISAFDATLRINNLETVVNRDGEEVVVNKNTEFVLVDKNNEQVAKYSIPYASKIKFKNGAEIKKGDILAEWDPYNYSTVAVKDGKVVYRDIVDGISVKEKIDESTGMSSKVVIDWRRFNSKQTLRPAVLIVNEKGDVIEEEELFIGTIINVSNGEKILQGDVLSRTPKDSAKTKDITGGLPRVSELFEARKPKNFAIMSAVSGTVEISDKDYKSKRVVKIIPDDEKIEPVSYVVPKGKHLFFNNGDKIKKGDLILDGDKDPHDILQILGIEEFAKYFKEEIQKVYELQGININDKHIEIIMKMMLQKVEITDAGETALAVGDVMTKEEIDEINKNVIAEGLEPAKYEQKLLGITRASLQNKSFISAASFQETVRVLTEASIKGRVDKLEGIKENVIVGKLINIGTGFVAKQLREEAEQKQQENISVE